MQTAPITQSVNASQTPLNHTHANASAPTIVAVHGSNEQPASETLQHSQDLSFENTPAPHTEVQTETPSSAQANRRGQQTTQAKGLGRLSAKKTVPPPAAAPEVPVQPQTETAHKRVKRDAALHAGFEKISQKPYADAASDKSYTKCTKYYWLSYDGVNKYYSWNEWPDFTKRCVNYKNSTYSDYTTPQPQTTLPDCASETDVGKKFSDTAKGKEHQCPSETSGDPFAVGFARWQDTGKNDCVNKIEIKDDDRDDVSNNDYNFDFLQNGYQIAYKFCTYYKPSSYNQKNAYNNAYFYKTKVATSGKSDWKTTNQYSCNLVTENDSGYTFTQEDMNQAKCNNDHNTLKVCQPNTVIDQTKGKPDRTTNKATGQDKTAIPLYKNNEYTFNNSHTSNTPLCSNIPDSSILHIPSLQAADINDCSVDRSSSSSSTVTTKCDDCPNPDDNKSPDEQRLERIVKYCTETKQKLEKLVSDITNHNSTIHNHKNKVNSNYNDLKLTADLFSATDIESQQQVATKLAQRLCQMAVRRMPNHSPAMRARMQKLLADKSYQNITTEFPHLQASIERLYPNHTLFCPQGDYKLLGEKAIKARKLYQAITGSCTFTEYQAKVTHCEQENAALKLLRETPFWQWLEAQDDPVIMGILSGAALGAGAALSILMIIWMIAGGVHCYRNAYFNRIENNEVTASDNIQELQRMFAAQNEQNFMIRQTNAAQRMNQLSLAPRIPAQIGEMAPNITPDSPLLESGLSEAEIQQAIRTENANNIGPTARVPYTQ